MNIKKVVITGPESTGKTLLAEKLAIHFNTVWISEYARDYITGLGNNYNYDDLEHIAREQVRMEKDIVKKANGFLFYDTYLVVTKVWFIVVYGKYPVWIDNALRSSGIDLFLVCNTDVPWIPDPVRENGGEMREQLLKMYIDEISSFGIPWKLVSGYQDKRTESAIEKVNFFF